MERGDPPTTQRKVKFPPIANPRRRPPAPKTESVDAENASLLRRAAENLGNRGNKVEKKSAVQVTFGPSESSSTSVIRTYGVPEAESSCKRSSIEPEVTDHEQSVLPLSKDVEEDGQTESSDEDTDYKEPWDYKCSLYPITLPLRKPYSGDPELLNEVEFGEAAMNIEYDENSTVPASDLGFLDESRENTMYFFQLPASLPILKQSATRTGKEKAGGSGSSEVEDLKKLPGGHLGKLLVYKSGTIKLRLGDTLYDVASGTDFTSAQNVVAINTKEGHLCDLGEISKRVVVTPDLIPLLNSQFTD